jgi:alkanesulfonate monooxygenase SsuD/methylene tetrahydromethanopterin reductase-like flavin-dependent oxidoreductase (luciferase family)
MRFSIWPSLSQPWADALAVARHAEATGWDGVYVADHFMGDGNTAGGAVTPMHEATAALAALAATTERVRLGSLVFGVTYRHPAVLANWAATVDHISGGRLLLGVGAGWQVNEHEQYGIELGPPGVRIDRFEEACAVLEGLLGSPVTTVDGEHYRLTEALSEPKPLQQPLPLLIGGQGDRMLGVVARHADEWNIWSTAGHFAERSGALDRACARNDRDPASIARSTQALWFLTDDVATADRLIENAAPRHAIGGPTERIVEAVGAWREAGVDEVIVPDFTLGTGNAKLERLDAVIETIAPAFR